MERYLILAADGVVAGVIENVSHHPFFGEAKVASHSAQFASETPPSEGGADDAFL
jgi:hypothetical protein